MAWTARDEEDKKEYFDSPEELDRKVTELVSWIKASRHMIIFTGAGISTAAGIPDFRSGMNTQIETGPGVWELRAHGKHRSSNIKTKSITQAIPTPTHMMFVKLMEEGVVKAVISQNCDGLHRRSGLPVKGLFELHGNSNVERCSKCKRDYLRDFPCRAIHQLSVTGARWFSACDEEPVYCDNPACKGDLQDTIIHFGENLPQDTLETSFQHAESADLCLAMGSSLTVTPAADIPKIVGQKKRLVIVNLQSTPLDQVAALRVFAKCDDFTRLLMEKLGLEIPRFELKRRLFFKVVSGTKVLVEEVDFEGNPFSYLKRVVFGGVVSRSCVPGKNRLECELPQGVTDEVEVTVQLELWGHYGEPDICLPFKVKPGKDMVVDVLLSYDPLAGRWSINRSDAEVQAVTDKMEASKI